MSTSQPVDQSCEKFSDTGRADSSRLVVCPTVRMSEAPITPPPHTPHDKDVRNVDNAATYLPTKWVLETGCLSTRTIRACRPTENRSSKKGNLSRLGGDFSTSTGRDMSL